MKDWIIYHNADCSKSRATLEILQAHNIEAQIINYLETPLSQIEIRSLLQKLGKSAQEVLRKNDAQSLSLGNLDNLSEAELVALIQTHPILLERPIIVHGDNAVIGRPPENVLTLLTDKESNL